MAYKSFPLASAINRLALSPLWGGISGEEHVPGSGAFLVAANHSSFLDGPFLATAFAWLRYAPLHMIAYREPFSHPLYGWMLRSGRCIPFDRASRESQLQMMRTALGYLQMNEPVGIFPEGHLNPTCRLRRARPGIALLALETGLPILPVGIRGAREVLPPHAKRPRFRQKISLHIGPLFNYKEEHNLYHNADKKKRQDLVNIVLTSTMRAIAECANMKEPVRKQRGGEP